jgi:hypothetical protein
MSKLRLCLSSLVLAASLSSAAAAHAPVERSYPIQIKPPVELDRAKVRAKLAARRKVVIERFLAYREARVYPWKHRGIGTRRHLWFDDLGNLCAAATLISGDWGRDATIKVGTTDRGIELAEVKAGPLADWMLTSGLAHHEIVAIQVPPMVVDDEMRPAETERLYAIYVDVERQLRALDAENLDLATDALMKRPDLARMLLAGKLPGPA